MSSQEAVISGGSQTSFTAQIRHTPAAVLYKTGGSCAGSVPMRPVISTTSITRSVSGSPSAAHYTWMGGNQRPLLSVRGAWPEVNPPLSLSPESLTGWSQCPISLLVYPLNCEDGWKSSVTSYRDLLGRVAPGLDGPNRSLSRHPRCFLCGN